MKNNTRTILITTFIITIVVFISLFSYGLSQFDNVRKQSRDIVENNNTKSELIFSMLSSARERVVDLFSMVNSDDPFVRDDLFLHFNKQGAIFATARSKLIELGLSEEEELIIKEQGRLTGLSVPIQLQLIELIQTDEIEQAKALLNGNGVEAQNAVLEVLSALLDLQQKSSHKIISEIDEQYENSQELVVVWSILAFLFGGFIAGVVIIKTSKTEHRLFEEMENIRAILTSISDVILRVNSQGDIVFANMKADEMFAMRVRGRHVSDVLSFISMEDIFNEEIDSGISLGRFEVELVSRSIWVDVVLETIRDEGGAVVGKVLVLHEVTDIVNAQKHLQRANENLEIRVSERTEKLQEANLQLTDSLKTLAEAQEQLGHAEKMAALGGLVAGISHEINTPVGISVTSATNIEERMNALEKSFNSGKLTKSEFESFMLHNRKGLDILISNLSRASELIKSFKQVAVDQSSDECRTIDLKEYCDEIFLSLHPKFKGLAVSVFNRVPEGINVFTNPGAIYQIISNLVVNSLLHAFEIPAENDEIVVEAEVADKSLVVRYYDNGKGVKKDDLSRIFEPFFTTKRGQGGSGLGMNLVYNLVTSTLNGQIKIMSQPDNGLHVNMTLPLKKEAA